MKHCARWIVVAAVAMVGSLGLQAAAPPVRVVWGTILPKGLEQETQLQELLQSMNKTAGEAAKFSVAPVSRTDSESTIVKKMGSRTYQAAVLSIAGLSEIHPDVTALQNMPLVFRSWAEVDFVREKLRPELEQMLLSKGYVTLFWSDAGWVNFFSKSAARTPSDFKKLKMFTWGGDIEQITIMKDLGYKPVPLEVSQIYPSLTTGVIECVPMPPTVALASQVQVAAKHMVDVKWAPIVGAAVIRKDTWDKLPESTRTKMLELCHKAGPAMSITGRRLNDQAIVSLQKSGVTVHKPSAEEMVEWEQLGAQLGPRIRGKIVPAGIYDRTQSLLKEFRAKEGA